MLTSRDVGAEKPDRVIFDRARTLAGLDNAAGARVVHVGDSWAADVQGSHAAGYEPVYVGRSRAALVQ